MKKDIEMTESAESPGDVSPPPQVFDDATQAISQGKRYLLVRDYEMAVSTLTEGVGMLATQYGEMGDELAEPYLLYGKALLSLARAEAGVFGTGVPDADEEAEEEEEEEAEAEEEPAENEKETNKEEAKPAAEEKKEETPKEGEKSTESKEKPAEEEKKPEEPKAGGSGLSSAGSSGASSSKMNGEASTSGLQQNGEAHGASDEEDDVDEEDDEPSSNLRIAWEVLELAKIILLKRGKPGLKLLADAHRLLGEVAMEGGNQPSAVADLNECLEVLQKLDEPEPRNLAMIHYQLGLAHSLGNSFDDSITHFLKATSLLESYIKELESSTEEDAAAEIKELKELLPEIAEKVSDMRDFKMQASKLVIEKIKSMSGGSCSNGAGPSSVDGSSSSSSAAATSSKVAKPATDISHLVRKKRKQEDEEDETSGSPCKKLMPEKAG